MFLATSLASIGYGAATVFTAWLLGRATDELLLPALKSGHASVSAVGATGSLIVGTAVLKGVSVAGRRLGAGLMQYRLQRRTRKTLIRQYLRLSDRWHRLHPPGVLLSNLQSDVESTWRAVGPLPLTIGIVITVMGADIAMARVSQELAALAALVYPLLLVTNLVYQRTLTPMVARVQSERAQLSGTLHESLDGALVIAAYGRLDDEVRRVRPAAQKLRGDTVRLGRVRAAFEAVLEFLPNAGLLMVLLVGVGQVGRREMSVGDLVQVSYLFSLLAFPVRSIGWLLIELPRGVAADARVRAVLDAADVPRAGTLDLPREIGPVTVKLRDVEFRADGERILGDVSLDIVPGRIVAVVGPTGAGKSTLAKILAGALEADRGAVSYNGWSTDRLRAPDLTRLVTFVPQHSTLFAGTVRDNVTLGLADVDDEEVWRALWLADADVFVRALSGGLDTEIGERGADLSGGQRQRLTIARALVRRSPLVVLDEATRSVDARTEQRIYQRLREFTTGRTVVTVTHRRPVAELADEVIFVEKGRIGACGKPGDLWSCHPSYRRLLSAESDTAGDGTPRAGRE